MKDVGPPRGQYADGSLSVGNLMQVGKEVTFPEEDSCGSCLRRVRREVGAGFFADLNGLTGSLQQCLLLLRRMRLFAIALGSCHRVVK